MLRTSKQWTFVKHPNKRRMGSGTLGDEENCRFVSFQCQWVEPHISSILGPVNQWPRIFFLYLLFLFLVNKQSALHPQQCTLSRATYHLIIMHPCNRSFKACKFCARTQRAMACVTISDSCQCMWLRGMWVALDYWGTSKPICGSSLPPWVV